MAIPQTNFNPPFNITRASHLVFSAQDLPASRAFYTEVIGLIVSDEDANTLWLRGVEERGHHSLTLKKTTRRAELRVHRHACVRRGGSRQGEVALRPHRHFGEVRRGAVSGPHLALQRSDGNAGRAGRDHAAAAAQSHVAVHTHKGARALRMDHYQVLVPDVIAGAAFYTDLGFRISDYLYVEGTDIVIGIFMYRKNNPWDLVLLNRSGPRVSSRRLRGRIRCST